MKFFVAVRGELIKMFRQRGTYAGYALLFALTALWVWGVWYGGSPADNISRGAGDEFAIGGSTLTGPMMPYMMLEIPVAINVFLPLLISMTAGGLIAAEAQRGTLRTWLTRPISRGTVISSKLVAGGLHAMTLVIFLGAISLASGYIVFGGGDLISISMGPMEDDGGAKFRILAEPQALQRLAIGYGLVAVTMLSVVALAMLCSTIFEHPLTASGVTVGFLIVSVALMVIPAFEWLQPYLLVSHFHSYRAVFQKIIDWPRIWEDLTWVGIYTTTAIAITALVFARRDMTC